MKRSPHFLVCLTVLVLVALSLLACGGVGSESLFTGRGSLAVFFQDAPVDNLLQFEITLVSVVLNPGSVSVLPQPVRLELTRLDLARNLTVLARNVLPGAYNQIRFTFFDPEIKFLDPSTGNVVEVRPGLQNLSPTFNVFFGISADQTTALLIDFDLNRSILTDPSGNITGVNPVLTLSGIDLAVETDEFEAEGRVVSVTRTGPDTGSFVFEPFTTCMPLTINIDSTTTFEDFDSAAPPLANSFASLVPNQFVDVTADLQPSGAFQGRKIEFEEPDNDEGLEGIILSAARDPGGNVTQFRLLLAEIAPCSSAARVGDIITVNVDTNTQFRLDPEGFTIDPTLFNDPSDLVEGQEVEAEPRGSFATTISADKIKLEDQTIRGTVLSVSGTTFQLNPSSNLFPDQSLEVQTTTGLTEFEHVSGVSGLTIAQLVRVKGFLLQQLLGPPPQLILVAEKVDGQP